MIVLYITWLSLLLLLFIIYSYGNKDFASPSFLLVLSFLVVVSIILYNTKNWDIEIHGFYWKTTICIYSAIIPFLIGSFLISLRFNRNNEPIVHYHIIERTNNYPYLFFSIASSILFLLFLRYKVGSVDFSSLINFTNSLNEYYTEGKSYGFLTTQILEAIVALAYISFHRMMVERFYLNKHINYLLIIPIILFLFATLLYTDRNILLRFMIFALVLFAMSYGWKGATIRNNRKLMFKIMVAVIAISIMFWLYGRLKEYTSNFERMVGIYAGSGLYGFNLWLHGFDSTFSHGELTFSSIINTLNALGFGEGTLASQHFEYIIYNSRNGYVFATNIYSALRVYYQDFGYLGIILISFSIGILFEILYQVAVSNKFGFWWLFYCAHIYHVVYYPIVEQFFLRAHFGLLYEILWLVLIYYFVYGNKGYWRYHFALKH